jgi:hypothetical protein
MPRHKVLARLRYECRDTSYKYTEYSSQSPETSHGVLHENIMTVISHTLAYLQRFFRDSYRVFRCQCSYFWGFIPGGKNTCIPIVIDYNHETFRTDQGAIQIIGLHFNCAAQLSLQLFTLIFSSLTTCSYTAATPRDL